MCPSAPVLRSCLHELGWHFLPGKVSARFYMAKFLRGTAWRFLAKWKKAKWLTLAYFLFDSYCDNYFSNEGLNIFIATKDDVEAK